MLGAIAAIVSIIAVLGSSGVTVANLYTNIKNQDLRAAIQSLVADVTSQLKSGRLRANKLISLLQNKNANALTQYLTTNPMVSKSLAEIQKDSDFIASISGELNSIESLIAQYQNELSALGYSASASGLDSERAKYDSVKKKLDEAISEHHRVTNKLEGVDVTPYRDFKVDTSHLDAVSQNIKGGQK